MKSITKVKQQRRIKNIPDFGDHRMSKENQKLQELVTKGVIVISKPQPRKVKKQLIRRMGRTSN
jgi:hypothetical protein